MSIAMWCPLAPGVDLRRNWRILRVEVEDSAAMSYLEYWRLFGYLARRARCWGRITANGCSPNPAGKVANYGQLQESKSINGTKLATESTKLSTIRPVNIRIVSHFSPVNIRVSTLAHVKTARNDICHCDQPLSL